MNEGARARHGETGFSTIDVVIAMVLTGIIGAFAFSGLSQYRSGAAVSKAKDQATVLARALDAAYPGRGYPADLVDLKSRLASYRVKLDPDARIVWYSPVAAVKDVSAEGFQLCVEVGPASKPTGYSAISATGAGGDEGRANGKGPCPSSPSFVGDSETSPLPPPCPTVSLTGNVAQTGFLGLTTTRTLNAAWDQVPSATGYRILFTPPTGTPSTTDVAAGTSTKSWTNLAAGTYVVTVSALRGTQISDSCPSTSYTF